MVNSGSIPLRTTNNKYNNMSRPMKMTPFLIKLIKEKSNVKNKR